MEIENLLKLINEVSKSGLSKFEYEENGVRVLLKAQQATPTIVTQQVIPVTQQDVPAMQQSTPVIENAQTGTEIPSNDVQGSIVKAPLVGTFYAAPSEGAKPFAQVGDVVKKGQVLGIIEAMKLMNEIECEVDGTVEEVYVENQEMIEYGQPLFRIR